MEADREITSLLKAGRWFGGLPAALQNLIIERSVRKSYRKGDYIVREGQPPKAMHAVLSGRVRVTRKVGDEQEELLIQLGEPGFWFGDYAVYAGASSIGSIVADTAVRTLALTVKEFERIVSHEPRYFRAFADLLFERYADLFRYLGESHGLAPEEWLRTRLIDHAAVMRRDNPAIDAGVISVGFRSIRVLG